MHTFSIASDTDFITGVDDAILRGVALQRQGINLNYSDREYLLALSRRIFNQEKIEEVTKNFCIENAIVFVSIYENDQLLACAFKQGKTLIESVILSTNKTIELTNLQIDSKNAHIEIAILFNKQNKTMEQIILGVDAICLEFENKMAIFKNSVAIKHGYSLEETLTKLAEKCGIEKSIIPSPKVYLSTFKVIEFREDFLTKNNRHGLYDLYRGNPLFLQKEVTKEALELSLWHSYSFLKKIAKENNFQAYSYVANEKKWHDSNQPEAVLRKIASTWIFSKLAKFYQDESGLESIKKMIDEIMKYFKSYDDVGYIEINGVSDIGINGCLLLLLISSGFYLDKISLLKKFVLNAYDKKNKRLLPIISPKLELPHESEFFFPGIALNALLQINKHYPDAETINILEVVFPYYLTLFQKSREEGIKMLLWMSAAYSELFLITKNNEYAEFVFEMNDLVLDQQISIETIQPDLIGSFLSKGNAGASAAVVESLIDAFRLAKFLQDDSKIKSYRKSILLALRFILQAQYRPDNTFDPNVIGGYKNNFFDRNIRIDNIQHAAHAVYKFLKYC